MSNELLDDFNYQEEEKNIAHAGFIKRFFAFILDSIIVSIAIIPFYILLIFIIIFLDKNLEEETFEILANILFLFLSMFYFPLFEGGKNQATPGKQIMKIKVVNESGGRISYGQAWRRYLARILCVITFFIGYIMAAFTEKKQGLHDIIAKTYVVDSQ